MRKFLLLASFVALAGLTGSLVYVASDHNSGAAAAVNESPTPAPAPTFTPYVLAAGEGELLRGGRAGHILVSPRTGSKHMTMASTPLPASRRINMHIHEHDEEIFFVHKGKGIVVLNDDHKPVAEGSVVFIPPGTWHGFEAGSDMHLIWVISPPHFGDLYRLFFKDDFNPTKEEGEALMKKHGYMERPWPEKKAPKQ